MSRSFEVQQAMRNVEIGHYRTGDADILAAEVERLEGLMKHVREERSSDLEAERGRAETAEARVRELEAEAADSAEDWAFCGLGVGSAAAAAMKHMEILKKYRDKVARLRKALKPFAAMEEQVSDWPAGAGVEIEECILEGHESFCVEDVRNAAKALADGGEATTTRCADCDWTFDCWRTGTGCRKKEANAS